MASVIVFIYRLKFVPVTVLMRSTGFVGVLGIAHRVASMKVPVAK